MAIPHPELACERWPPHGQVSRASHQDQPLAAANSNQHSVLAERAGFEPAVGILSLRTLSKRLPSATRSPLQAYDFRNQLFEPIGSGVMYRSREACQRHEPIGTPRF